MLRLSLSLRTALIAFTCVVVATGLVSNRIRRRLAVRESAQQLTRWGAALSSRAGSESVTGLPYDGWLGLALGCDDEVVGVSMRIPSARDFVAAELGLIECKPMCSDAELSDALRTLSDLESVELFGPWVSDEVVSALGDVRNLHTADLRGTHVGEKGARSLTSAPRLSSLRLGEGCCDEALVALQNCSHLSSLYLGKTLIGGEREAKRNWREVPGASITDAGLRRFTSKGLCRLDLRGCSITDTGLEGIEARLPNLEYINLAETKITDAGLARLRKLPKLRSVVLVEEVYVLAYDATLGPPVTATLVTTRGVAELAKTNPQVTVVFSDRNVYGSGTIRLDARQ